MKTPVLLFLSLILCSNMAFSQTKAEKKAAKREQETKDYTDMKKLVDSKAFYFEADWLTTQSGNRINLTTNPNFLMLDHDTASADLPYLGVVQIPNYGDRGGIYFEGPITKYQINYNEKKHFVTVKFSTTSKNTESFNITIKVFANKNAAVFVYSTNRNSINYEGIITPVPEKKE